MQFVLDPILAASIPAGTWNRPAPSRKKAKISPATFTVTSYSVEIWMSAGDRLYQFIEYTSLEIIRTVTGKLFPGTIREDKQMNKHFESACLENNIIFKML
jgi:hypothetical protein